MGGETSKYLRARAAERRAGRTASSTTPTNGDCAAGTGAFIDQQAGRLQVRRRGHRRGSCLSAERAAQVAGRCSVFAKSDMIHAQQKGFTPAGGASRACATRWRGTSARPWSRPHPVEPPVALARRAWRPTRPWCGRCARCSSWTTAQLVVPAGVRARRRRSGRPSAAARWPHGAATSAAHWPTLRAGQRLRRTALPAPRRR